MSDTPRDHAAPRRGRHPSGHLETPGLRPAADRRNHDSRDALLRRVRAEFDEFCGLKLTQAQARRLFGMREDVCRRVMSSLVREGVLRLSGGMYVSGTGSRMHTA